MNILTTWLRHYLPTLSVSDPQLAEDLTLRGIAVEGVHDLGAGNGHLFEMDITTNRVDAMNHYGIAREAATIYGVALKQLDVTLPEHKPTPTSFSVKIEAEDAFYGDAAERQVFSELRVDDSKFRQVGSQPLS